MTNSDESGEPGTLSEDAWRAADFLLWHQASSRQAAAMVDGSFQSTNGERIARATVGRGPVVALAVQASLGPVASTLGIVDA